MEGGVYTFEGVLKRLRHICIVPKLVIGYVLLIIIPFVVLTGYDGFDAWWFSCGAYGRLSIMSSGRMLHNRQMTSYVSTILKPKCAVL